MIRFKDVRSRVINAQKQQGMMMSKDIKYINNIMYIDDRIWIPEIIAMDWVNDYHIKYGHIGINKLYYTIRRYYYIKDLMKLCKIVNRNCNACQKHKYDCSQRVRSYVNERPHDVFDKIYMDTLFLDRDNDSTISVLNIVDGFSGYVIAVPVTSTTGDVIVAAINALFKQLDMIPNVITTDSGPAFISQRFREYCYNNNIKLVYSSAYNARSHGIVERANQTITRMLATTIHSNNGDVIKSLYDVVIAYNTSVHSYFKHVPATIFHNKQYVDYNAKSLGMVINNSINNEIKSLRIKHGMHYDKISKFNNKWNKFRSYNNGDLVLIKVLSEDKKRKKLLQRYEGPFIILKKKSSISYLVIKVNNNGRYIGKVFGINIRYIKPYYN